MDVIALLGAEPQSVSAIARDLRLTRALDPLGEGCWISGLDCSGRVSCVWMHGRRVEAVEAGAGVQPVGGTRL
jgi:hypothetical protein